VLNLNRIVADMEDMLRRIIGEDVELETALAPHLWPVEVDPAQIEQVIVNLAVNARDAMPTGGRLTIETTNVVPEHLEAGPGEYVLLSVSDTGIGMSEEVQAHIFEPFFTTKERGKGTGLGLSTVYGIVKQHNGDIQVLSQQSQPAPSLAAPQVQPGAGRPGPDQAAWPAGASRDGPPGGTAFKIYLPRARKAAQPVTHPSLEREMPSGGETILLVEDDEGVRDLSQYILKKQGYTLLVAENGQRALELADGHSGPIHLLLADVVLPGMSSKVLCEQLAQSRPNMRIMYMSGYSDDAIGHYGVLESETAFLQKPFGPVELTRQVREVLDAPRQEVAHDDAQKHLGLERGGPEGYDK
jgi:CheY-like chemotaxis protein